LLGEALSFVPEDAIFAPQRGDVMFPHDVTHTFHMSHLISEDAMDEVLREFLCACFQNKEESIKEVCETSYSSLFFPYAYVAYGVE